MKLYAKLSLALLAAWLVFALTASALHVFQNTSQRIGLPVALAAGTPIMLFVLWFAASRSFRQFTSSLPARTLTLVQSWRVLGLVFVLLEARGVLPAVFALPAGYGDMFIGLTAPFAALVLAKPSRRAGFVLWQLLGIADLVMAVGLGTTARLLDHTGPSMLAMTVLPLSLVPTFIVPLLLMLHVICIAQAMSWKSAPGQNDALPNAGALRAQRSAL